jgi:hypothetical protein
MTGEPPRDKWTPRTGEPAARVVLDDDVPVRKAPSRVRARVARWVRSASVQIAVFLILLVGLSSLVLLTAYRSTGCGQHHAGRQWSFVAPWQDPPRDCRKNRSGFTFLRDEIGL